MTWVLHFRIFWTLQIRLSRLSSVSRKFIEYYQFIFESHASIAAEGILA